MKRLNFILLCCLSTISHFAYALDVGIGIHPQGFPGTPEQIIAELQKYKFSTFRTDYPWGQVEKQKGMYQPVDGKIEKTIELAKKNNIQPLIIYDYGNNLYEPQTSQNPLSKPTSLTSIDAFVNYVSWSTKHLKNNVSMFEIWNEWIQMAGKANRSDALGQESAKIYADMTIKSCRAIKKINPKAIVLAGSTSPLDELSNQWLIQVLNYGVLNCIDGISLHGYRYAYNQKLNYHPIISSIKELQFKLKYLNNGKAIPFYITEAGVPNIKKSVYSLQDSTDFFTGYLGELSKLNYVKGIWWYDLVNDGIDPNDNESNFGILNRDLSPKPIALKFADTIKKYK